MSSCDTGIYWNKVKPRLTLLAMFEGLLNRKKEEKEYLTALVVTEDRIDAALWETSKDGTVKILKTAGKSYANGWESAIDAADSSVTDIETALPEGRELSKVVFGLPSEWLFEDHIKETYLKQLKQLTAALSLKPIGFVELPVAVAHLLQKDEGTPQTVILIGLESKHVSLSLFKIGKLIGIKYLERSAAINADVEKILSEFADVEVLPSRMLIYSTTADSEKVKAELLTYPWQKKANFLHFPKIEMLSPGYTVKAVAIASATELTAQVETETDAAENEEEVPANAAAETADEPVTAEAGPEKEAIDEVESPAVSVSAESETTSDEVGQVAEDLGFKTTKAGAEIDIESEMTDVAEPVTEEAENVAPADLPLQENPPERKLPRVKLPTFKLPQFAFSLPNLPGRLSLAVIGALSLILISIGAAVWLVPQAKVKILVQPKLFDKTESITVSTAVETANIADKVLPGKVAATEITGTVTVPTTGTKTVGDKAKGEVTIFNKTLNTKNFKKGTTLVSGKLEFTLDDDTEVASASEGVGSLTYGTTKANITAVVIGTASNVSSGTDFTFDDLPTTSYTARNEKSLSGGTSREISVVTREDQQDAREQAMNELKGKAEEQIAQTLTESQKILDNSLQTKIIKESFSREIGDEADELQIEVQLSVDAAAYTESDFDELLKSIVVAQLPSGYKYEPQNQETVIDEITMPEEGVWVFKPHIKVKLLPDIDTSGFAKSLAGRSLDSATSYLKEQSGVAGVAYDAGATVPFMSSRLPFNPSRITVELSAL